MKTLIAALFVLITLNHLNSVHSNPFKSKLPQKSEITDEPSTEALTYKGFISLDNNMYGFIQIGENDYEVAEGETIEAYTILKISRRSLKYQYMKETHSLLLELDQKE